MFMFVRIGIATFNATKETPAAKLVADELFFVESTLLRAKDCCQ